MPIQGQPIGIDISKASDSFLQTFMQIKQYKAMKKYRDLAPVIETMKGIISDENTPLDSKIKAMDALGHTLNPKERIPLSQQMGIKDLAEHQIQTSGTTQEKGEIISPEGQPNETDPTKPPPPMQTLKDVPAQYKRRGELSDADFRQMRQEQSQQRESGLILGREEKLSKIRAEERAKELQDSGWEKRGESELDTKTNQYQQTWVNPRTGKTRTIKYEPGVIPSHVLETQMKSEASQNKPSQMMKDKVAFYKTQINPKTSSQYTEDEAEFKALEDVNEYRKAQVDYLHGGVTERTQKITGTEKPTPQQNREFELKKIELQQKHSALVASSAKSEELAKTAQEDYNNQLAKVNESKKNLEEMLTTGGYDKEDKEYSRASLAHQKLEQELQKAKTKLNSVQGEAQRFKTQVQDSKSNLAQVGIDLNSSSSAPKNLSDTDHKKIKQFMKDNPSITSEEEAEKILRTHGRIK